MATHDRAFDARQGVPRPGRLGDPEMSLGSDPRADPRMVAALRAVGLDGHGEPAPVTATSPYEEQLGFIEVVEPGFQMLFGALFSDLPAVAGVERSTEQISGPNSRVVTVHIHRPAGGGAAEARPGVLHLHGGGMTLLSAADPNYVRWRDLLAAAGLVVVGVEFRNAAGALGPHPFPAGLDDCATALAWMHANRAQLGVSKLVVSGESGGANLTLATTLRAAREAMRDAIDGVYAQCPYISGSYATPPPELPSLIENDEYFLGGQMMGVMAAVYDPLGQHARDPLAWPYFAEVDDLRGLPPHVISVNELDPLRDEGLAYHRRLLAAGVSSVSRTVNGTCHAGDLIFEGAIPDVTAATIRDIAGFAHSL
jgi:acetyl esterase